MSIDDKTTLERGRKSRKRAEKNGDTKNVVLNTMKDRHEDENKKDLRVWKNEVFSCHLNGLNSSRKVYINVLVN